MILILYLLLVFVGLLLVQEIFRRFPKPTLILFIVLPICLIPFRIIPSWIDIGAGDWFPWVKLFSLIVFVIWLSILRLTNIGKNKLAKRIVYILLVINILEAIARGLLDGGMANYFNAAAGILMIATLNKIDSINITNDQHKDIVWDSMTLAWIIGHTIWDWTFIYLNFAAVSIHHLAVLGAPLAVAFINRGKWLQARVITLYVYLLFFYSLPRKSVQNLYSFWGNESTGLLVAEASLIFMIIYT